MEKNLNGAPSRSAEQIIIRHRPLVRGDATELLDVIRRAAAAVYVRMGRDPARMAEAIRDELLDAIAGVLTERQVRRLIESNNRQQQCSIADEIKHDIALLIDAKLVPHRHIPRAGRPKKLSSRDHRIYELRSEGLSYTQIGNKLKISRGAVQAAYRRAATQRLVLRDIYADYKEYFLERFNVLLQEET